MNIFVVIIQPEHQEVILKPRKEAARFTSSNLDEQQWQEMAYFIEETIEYEQPIGAKCAYDELSFCGFVDKVDVQNKYILLSNGNDGKKIPFPNFLM